jgi:hypothetical protein
MSRRYGNVATDQPLQATDGTNVVPTVNSVGTVGKVRTLGPGVVLVRSVVEIVPLGKDELNPTMNAIQSLGVVAKDPDLEIGLLPGRGSNA